MKRKMTSSLLLCGGLFLAGCQGSDQAFLASADKFVNTTVGPEYETYVNGDPALSPAQKADRLQNVQSFRDAVAQKAQR